MHLRESRNGVPGDHGCTWLTMLFPLLVPAVTVMMSSSTRTLRWPMCPNILSFPTPWFGGLLYPGWCRPRITHRGAGFARVGRRRRHETASAAEARSLSRSLVLVCLRCRLRSGLKSGYHRRDCRLHHGPCTGYRAQGGEHRFGQCGCQMGLFPGLGEAWCRLPVARTVGLTCRRVLRCGRRPRRGDRRAPEPAIRALGRPGSPATEFFRAPEEPGNASAGDPTDARSGEHAPPSRPSPCGRRDGSLLSGCLRPCTARYEMDGEPARPRHEYPRSESGPPGKPAQRDHQEGDGTAIIAISTAVTGFYGQNVPYPGFSEIGGFFSSVAFIVRFSTLVFSQTQRLNLGS